MRLAIDMDETVSDAVHRLLSWYERDFGVTLERSALHGAEFEEIVAPEHAEAVRDYPRHPDFFRDLPIIDGAVSAIQALSDTYEIFFVTAAMEYPTSFQAKFEWLETHFEFVDSLNFIFCGTKKIINADILIDDRSRHIDHFDGRGLLFTAEHNINLEGYERVSSWKEVEGLLLK